MLCWYAVNVAGPMHKEKGIPCQDSYCVDFANDAILVAVADGLGSESRSDVGAQTAAAAAVRACKDGWLDAGRQNPEGLIRNAFAVAYNSVLDAAASQDGDPGQYDCTLSMAIFQDGKLWWGQSGDSGIVACMDDGSYQLVTKMQRDADGRVFPLCFDECWEFGMLDGVASFAACTDGVLEWIAPPVLAKHWSSPIDGNVAHQFLHPHPSDFEDLRTVQEEAQGFLDDISRELIDDDKTLVIVFDKDRLPREREAEYYRSPDWAKVDESVRRALYAASSKEDTIDLGEAACEQPAREEQ